LSWILLHIPDAQRRPFGDVSAAWLMRVGRRVFSSANRVNITIHSATVFSSCWICLSRRTVQSDLH